MLHVSSFKMAALVSIVLLNGITPLCFGLPSDDFLDENTRANEDNCNESLFGTNEFREKAFRKLENIKFQFNITNKVEKKNPDKSVRTKRDGYDNVKTVVRCKNSYTGLFSFLAVPLLMGDIMLDFMSMIDIMIMIMTPEAEPAEPAEPGEPTGNNNNNNNNNGGEAGEPAEPGEGGNNNNNMNARAFINSRSRRRWTRESWEEIYQNVSAEFVMEKMPSFLDNYLDPKSEKQQNKLPSSGDWTDGADYIQDIRGPFSGVLGWNNVGSKNVLSKKFKNHIHNKK